MPQVVAEDEVLRRLREHLARPHVKAGTVARMLGLERTLVWRVSVGRAISAKNRDLLASRIHLLEVTDGSTQATAKPGVADSDVQQLVAQSKALLRFLLDAVESIEQREGAAMTGSADK
jgi:hypothetical protein